MIRALLVLGAQAPGILAVAFFMEGYLLDGLITLFVYVLCFVWLTRRS